MGSFANSSSLEEEVASKIRILRPLDIIFDQEIGIDETDVAVELIGRIHAHNDRVCSSTQRRPDIHVFYKVMSIQPNVKVQSAQLGSRKSGSSSSQVGYQFPLLAVVVLPNDVSQEKVFSWISVDPKPVISEGVSVKDGVQATGFANDNVPGGIPKLIQPLGDIKSNRVYLSLCGGSNDRLTIDLVVDFRYVGLTHVPGTLPILLEGRQCEGKYCQEGGESLEAA